MGQIKNIKLHIVTDIKLNQLTPPSLRHWLQQTETMSLLRVGLRSILQSAAKTRVALPMLKSARCLTILSNNTTPKTTISSSFPSSITSQRYYGAHATDFDDKVKEFLMLFDKIDPSKIANEAKLCADLGLDSLDIVEVAIMLADEFCPY